MFLSDDPVARYVSWYRTRRDRMSPLELFLDDAGRLSSLYWMIRYQRSANRRRTFYRRAAKEKAQLVGLGWSPELVRLYCLHLRDLKRPGRYEKFLQEFYKPVQLPLF